MAVVPPGLEKGAEPSANPRGRQGELCLPPASRQREGGAEHRKKNAFILSGAPCGKVEEGAESKDRQFHPRARVTCVFPNPASLLRLVSAALNEISDDWESANTYLNMNPPSHQQTA